MKVIILNKREFAKFMEFNMIDDSNVESQNAMFISINQTYQEDEKWDVWGRTSYFKRQHSNVMIMHFPDVGEMYHMRFPKDPNLFTKFKAKKLYEFIKRNKDKNLAILHCAAGISRSGAVGTFIYDLYGRDTMTYEEFRRKNPRIQPNSYILNTLHEIANKDTNR